MLSEMGVNPDQQLIDFIKRWHLVREEDQVPGQVLVPTTVTLGGILRDHIQKKKKRLAECRPYPTTDMPTRERAHLRHRCQYLLECTEGTGHGEERRSEPCRPFPGRVG